jgi:hypothetical protein
MRLKLLPLTCIIAALTACGGGGGGGGGGGTGDSSTNKVTPNASAPVTYQAVASEGELVSYTVDTTALTYAYSVIESAYGKTGVTGSGKLTRNSDGSYTPSGFNGKIAILASGLLLGAIYEDLNGDNVKEIVPVIGIANPITSMDEGAGTYNFVSRQCGSFCTNYYGTVQVQANGNWNSCVGANLASGNPICQGTANGTISNFSAGRATLLSDNAAAGSMLIFKDAASSQKVVLLDLNGRTNLGRGALFAASQSLPASADGNWSYLHTDGTNGVVRVTGTNFTDAGKTASGYSYNSQGSFTLNQPWNGFIRTASGATIMPAGSGLYAGYFGESSSMSIGVKQ